MTFLAALQSVLRRVSASRLAQSPPPTGVGGPAPTRRPSTPVTTYLGQRCGPTASSSEAATSDPTGGDAGDREAPESDDALNPGDDEGPPTSPPPSLFDLPTVADTCVRCGIAGHGVGPCVYTACARCSLAVFDEPHTFRSGDEVQTLCGDCCPICTAYVLAGATANHDTALRALVR